MNEWMNEFFKKEHTGPPRTCGYEESTPRGQHSARTALMLVHCQRTAWTRPLLPQRPWRRGGEGSQSGSRPCSALAHAAMPRLRSRGEQGTHIPPQDSRHVHCHSLHGCPAVISLSLPWTWGGPSWPCPGPSPALLRGQRGLPGGPSSLSAPVTSSWWFPWARSPEPGLRRGFSKGERKP